MNHAHNTQDGTIVNPKTDKIRDGFCSSCDRPLNPDTGECAGCSD